MLPGFTEDLCTNIRQQKAEREPVESKIVLDKNMQNFLQSKTNPGLFSDEKAGIYLKDGRKWSTNRQVKPYNLTFKLPGMTNYSSASKTKPSKAMDYESTPTKK